MSYGGRVRNGVVVLDGGVELPEGIEVRVEPLVSANDPPSDDAVADEMLKLAGIVDGLPADLSRNLDHYLYGVPKK